MQCLKHASAIDIPVFDKLIQLEISFGSYSWDLLANLLQRSHKLEVLMINKVQRKNSKSAGIYLYFKGTLKPVKLYSIESYSQKEVPYPPPPSIP
ncbi:hypothetical protein ACSQ67_016503 [Phaseolus vulgaris]